MSVNDEHKEQRIGLWLAASAAALATLAVLFFSVWGWQTGRIEGSPDNGAASRLDAELAVPGCGDVPQDMEMQQSADCAAPADAGHDHAAAAAASEALALAAAPADIPDAGAAVAAGQAAVMVENGVVKFYFATGKSDLAEGTQEALKDVIEGVKAGRKAVISGFHDSTGNQALNEELSKQRALAVKNALLGFGAAEEQIELRKPADSEAGEGNNAEARRVEVVLE